MYLHWTINRHHYMLLVPQDLSYTEYRQPLMEVVEVVVKMEAV